MLDVKRQLSEAIKSPFYIRIKLERNKDHFASDWLGFISIILKGYLKNLIQKGSHILNETIIFHIFQWFL
jgi:hypothetical protein